MQTLLTNVNQSYKREHRAHCQITKLIKMKKKVISFIGLALFVGAVAFNVQMTNSNKQGNEVILKNIEALASGSEAYCKNLPSKNDGKCYEYTEGGDYVVACRKQDDNQDCYGVAGSL